MGRPLLVLAAVFLVVSCLEDFQRFCHDQACPRYQLTNTYEGFEERSYEATRWISTNIESNTPIKIGEAYQRLKTFCDNNGDAGNNISLSWPRLITQIENKFYLQWFIPPGTAVPTDDPPSVTVELRPETTFYVRMFSGMPSLESGQLNTGLLIEDLKKEDKSYTQHETIGAGYEPVFFIPHHNEIWISAA